MENVDTASKWSLFINLHGSLSREEGHTIVLYYNNDKEAYAARDKYMETLKNSLRFSNGITIIENFVFNNSELNAFRLNVNEPIKFE